MTILVKMELSPECDAVMLEGTLCVTRLQAIRQRILDLAIAKVYDILYFECYLYIRHYIQVQ